MFLWRPSVSLGMQAPLTNAHFTPQVQTFNEAMSEVGISLEWIFEAITNYYKFVDFKKQLDYNISPVWIIYFMCGILQNVHTCLYRNLGSDYFNLDPPSL